jgi:hypothetical protein
MQVAVRCPQEGAGSLRIISRMERAVLSAVTVRVDQAALTGESLPVE